MKHIGICGTFDVQNYGDLLFPLIAETELSRRLGPITLHRFSYSRRTPPAWPYEVSSLTELPGVVDSLDGMLIGGGHLIRFDKNVAPGYAPPSIDIHHPTGYWLAPALICIDQDCPVAWNAPGGGGIVPAWAASLMHIAVGASDYVSVRDEDARAMLGPFDPQQKIKIVPDTAFGVARLVDAQRPSPAMQRLRESLELRRPYILIQAQRGFAAFGRLLARHPDKFSGYQLIALPTGPALGDDVALIENDFPTLLTPAEYPDPRLVAELVAGAAAVVGISLHLAITAIALGVPVFRPAYSFVGKYAWLARHAGVYSFDADTEITAEWFEAVVARRGDAADCKPILQQLDQHWDDIASCFPGRRNRRQGAASVWQRLPGLLEDELITQTELGERTQQIADLELRVASSDRQIAAAAVAMDQLRAQVTARNDEIRALRESKSWKLTAPLRWLVGRRAVKPRILRIDRIAQEHMAVTPYEWAFVNGLFSSTAGRALTGSYPCDNFKTVKGYDGEKGFEYESRPLIHMHANSVSFADELSDAWRHLATDLLSPAYREAMTRLTGRDLSAAPMEAYVCHFGPGAWLGPHIDLKEKIVTHVLYFNDDWDGNAGGCLNILNSRDMTDTFAQITPIVGNSSVLVRSGNSWHSVSRVQDGCRSSRRSVNVIFYHPGAVSTMFPPGDNTPLHRYMPETRSSS